MARRGARPLYEDDEWSYSGKGGQRRVNGDNPASTTSMTREFDDLMRTIEADWNFVTPVDVRSSGHPVDASSIPQWKRRCNLWIEARWAETIMPSRHCTAGLNVHCNLSLMVLPPVGAYIRSLPRLQQFHRFISGSGDESKRFTGSSP
jgi:hypothetical protein